MRDLYKQLLEKMLEVRFQQKKVWLPGEIQLPGRPPVKILPEFLFDDLKQCEDRFPDPERWNAVYDAQFPTNATYADIAQAMQDWIQDTLKDLRQRSQHKPSQL